MRSIILIILLTLALGASLDAQIPKDDPVVAQEAWFERQHERSNLIPGAFEVLRFPTGWEFKPRYEHDQKHKRRILNPDFYCSQCAREKRIPKDRGAGDHHLMEFEEEQVLDWVGKELKTGRVTFIEDGSFKLLTDLPGVNLKMAPNPFLKEELLQLGDIFPKVTQKTAVINGHQRAHLYLIRAHRLLRDFHWMVGMSPDEIRKKYHWLGPHLGMTNKLELYVFSRQRAYLAFCKRYIGRSADDGQCWHLFKDLSMVMVMQAQGYKDNQTQNFFLHRIMHNLLDAYRKYTFKLPAWFQMGMGHWVERRETTRYNSFCFSEGTLPKVLYQDRWAPKVRKMVMKPEGVLPFVAVCSKKEYGEFPPKYHMVTHSWVSYLWRLGPKKMPIFINALKDKKESETLYQAQIRAFRKAYGISLLQFDTGWREWVKEVYPSN